MIFNDFSKYGISKVNKFNINLEAILSKEI